MSAGKTVLVTGGSGYLGSWVVIELLRKRYTVRTTIRNLAREAAVRAAIATVVDPRDRLSFYAADLLHDAGWDAATAGTDFASCMSLLPCPSASTEKPTCCGLRAKAPCAS